ncbi:SEC12-like protein 2 [Apium graveolens]|uniref:SEC12-like protein 2 n=1 Tax=Apium graveolens TaxID=4045 RepID=UPI003D7AE4E6
MVIANSKSYGVPLYGASWLPLNLSRSKSEDDSDESPPSIDTTRHVVLSGGGGEGKSGIPNAILVSQFFVDSNSLSDQPVAKLGTGTNLPYRMAVHPGGEGLICSMPQSCRWFEWDEVKSDDVCGWGLKSSEKILSQLEDIGQQLALTFDDEGSALAVGGEDGKLRVFKWPSMDSILDESNAHASVKDLSFSPDGKFLASVGSSGPGRIWDIASSTPVAALPKVKDERFGFCRFSHSIQNNQVLYVTAMQGRGGSIIKWNTTLWTRISLKHITRDSITAFNVSADGKYLAVGTMEGDILVLHSSSMRLHTAVKKAHLGIVTSLMFSHDSRALLSTSFDSSARVTLVEDKKERGLSLWVILFMMLLAIAVYYSKLAELLSLSNLTA